MVAGECRRIVGKLYNHVAGARAAFGAFELARAHDIACAILPEDRLITGSIGLIALLVPYIDPADPVALCHPLVLPMTSPLVRFRPRLHPLPPWGRAPQEWAGQPPGSRPRPRLRLQAS